METYDHLTSNLNFPSQPHIHQERAVPRSPRRPEAGRADAAAEGAEADEGPQRSQEAHVGLLLVQPGGTEQGKC